MKKIYTEEDIRSSNAYRSDYYASIADFVAALGDKNAEERKNTVTPEYFAKNRDSLKKIFVDMLGYPLNKYVYGIPKAERQYVGEDDYRKIYRVTINTVGKIKFYGILTLPRREADKYPLLVAQHGGWGSPELLLDIHEGGNYSHISRIASEKGFAVFAPQLLLWNFTEKDRPNYGDGVKYDRFSVNAYLGQNGGSIIALETYNIRKSLDYIMSLDCIDETKVGMLGLSYGGFYTLYTAASDERIKAAYSCAAFNDRNRQGCGDWHLHNSNFLLQDAEVAALCAPRAVFVDVGKNDEVFDYRYAVKEAERAESLYNAVGGKGIKFNFWNGGHKIDVNGPYLDKFFNAVNQ